VFRKWIATVKGESWCGRRACPGKFDSCKVQRRNSPTSPHARNWPTEGVIPTGQY
jgi:hypothetical protein